MRNRFMVMAAFAAVAVFFCLPVLAQNAVSQQRGAGADPEENTTAASARHHDISGTWAPWSDAQIRVEDRGVVVTPDPLPFTAYGLQVYKSHHPTAGPTGVVPELSDDPRDK